VLIKISTLLTASGHLLGSEEASELYVDEVLDGSGRFCYVDRVVRMTALTEAEVADRFYGVQQELFPVGDPHGS